MVDVAIIVPVWGQGPLLCESISSILDQETEAKLAVFLMDDACPQSETVEVCRRFARARPDEVFYWRSPVNRGLSAMRNEGVELALRHFPDLYAVLSFDGDDRMHPHLIERSLTALKSAREAASGESWNIGWVFEDPDHFGQDGVMLRTHRYSALWSMAGCANCPTSLTHGDVYRAGIRFREDMKSGSEDWQFWLTCLSKGFRGAYVPNLGFRYRRRPGSMSVGALQLADSNKTDIRLSLPEVFHPDFFLAEEARELPRYVEIRAEGALRIKCSAEDSGEQIAIPDLAETLAHYAALPTARVPQFAIFAPTEALTMLGDRGLTAWAYWQLEDLTRSSGAASLCLEPSGPGPVRRIEGTDADPALRCLTIDALLEFCRGKTKLDRLEADLSTSAFLLPGAERPALKTVTAFRAFLASLKDAFQSHTLKPRSDMTTWRPFGLRPIDLPKDFFDIGSLLAGQGLREETLLVADETLLRDPAGLDLVHDLARTIRSPGVVPPSLLCLGSHIPELQPGTFTRILLALPDGTGRGFFRGIESATGLIAPFGTIVNVGSGKIVPALNKVRGYKRRVIGILPEGLERVSDLEENLHTSFKVFESFLTFSERARCRSLALGIAEEQCVASLEEALEEAAV
ncbi:MAG: glycosyltransferase [Pseudomonadota bacterium]